MEICSKSRKPYLNNLAQTLSEIYGVASNVSMISKFTVFGIFTITQGTYQS